MRALMRKDENEEMIRPNMKTKIEEEAPEKLNAYSDGSLRNVEGSFWHVGGAGVWRKIRKEEEVTEGEKAIAEYQGHEEGVRLWCAFNTSLNSSTRCELGAAILAMLAPRLLNIASIMQPW